METPPNNNNNMAKLIAFAFKIQAELIKLELKQKPFEILPNDMLICNN